MIHPARERLTRYGLTYYAMSFVSTARPAPLTSVQRIKVPEEKRLMMHLLRKPPDSTRFRFNESALVLLSEAA